MTCFSMLKIYFDRHLIIVFHFQKVQNDLVSNRYTYSFSSLRGHFYRYYPRNLRQLFIKCHQFDTRVR